MANLEQRMNGMIETLAGMIATEPAARTRAGFSKAYDCAVKALAAWNDDHPTLAVLYLQDAEKALREVA